MSFSSPEHLPPARVWPVGDLCRAIADALAARFNPVQVRGEISGFTRAASGHCYFSLKDATGQLRCAMFRRAASALDFLPRDGDLVEVSGRLAVYEPRGELQLVAEALRRAGQGTLFEQFLLLKERLAQEGLFDAARKRALPAMPRAIGVVTSLGAAALHDVVTTLQRRVPHVAVLIAPAQVQGAAAPQSLQQALLALYSRIEAGAELDTILLVRGGGSLEDLWAFNDESLARCIAESPVPLISGVGHETDFTIADFVADVRAPTPTAAAEMVCEPTRVLSAGLQAREQALQRAMQQCLDRESQTLDRLATRLGRPQGRLAAQAAQLMAWRQALATASATGLHKRQLQLQARGPALLRGLGVQLAQQRSALDKAGLRLQAQDPQRILQRGYAWLATQGERPVSSVRQLQPGQALRAVLADGKVDLAVQQVHGN